MFAPKPKEFLEAFDAGARRPISRHHCVHSGRAIVGWAAHIVPDRRAAPRGRVVGRTLTKVCSRGEHHNHLGSSGRPAGMCSSTAIAKNPLTA